MGLALPLVIFVACNVAWKLLHFLVLSNLWALKIPTVEPAHPIFGHLLVFTRKAPQQVFWSLAKLFNGVDRVAKLRIGPLPIVLVNHPELMQELMNRAELTNKPIFYRYLGFGRGLISEQRGHSWRCDRKLLNPTFCTGILNEFVPIMDGRAKRMMNKLEILVKGGGELDIFPVVSQCTLEMVFSTTLGCKMEEREGEQKYISCLEQLADCIVERILNVDTYFKPLYRCTKLYSTTKTSKDFCYEFTDKIIQERKKELFVDSNCRHDSASGDGIQAKSLNFLDQILTINKPDGSNFTDKEVSEHIFTLVAAGNETSALTTAYACLNLALEPDVQSKAIDEIQQVFHSPSVAVTPETLKQLVYLEMVIKETLRLFPSVPFVGRSTAAPVELDGIRIPKDQIICFSFYNLHRRKDIWGDDVERFDPERFRPELVKERHPYAFLPFSGGYRNCMGGRYAMNALKVILLNILQRYELSTSLKRQDLRFRWAISMKLMGPHAVRFTNRDLYGSCSESL